MSAVRTSIKFRILAGTIAASAVLAGVASVGVTQADAGHGMTVVKGHGMSVVDGHGMTVVYGHGM